MYVLKSIVNCTMCVCSVYVTYVCTLYASKAVLFADKAVNLHKGNSKYIGIKPVWIYKYPWN